MDSAEQIVRDLAANPYPEDSEWGCCVLCPNLTAMSDALNDHESHCTWRRARELYPEAVPAPMPEPAVRSLYRAPATKAAPVIIRPSDLNPFPSLVID